MQLLHVVPGSIAARCADVRGCIGLPLREVNGAQVQSSAAVQDIVEEGSDKICLFFAAAAPEGAAGGGVVTLSRSVLQRAAGIL